MKRVVLGILAHVDSGKTTLSEGLLYAAGAISRRGRVDHQDAFLDTEELEKKRGITIFSKQAVLKAGDTEITLLDTPGHVDFSAETERTLSVLDYAILVVNGADGVQSHTKTLWKLLERYQIPTFLFINKMDLETADKTLVLSDLKENLNAFCLDPDSAEFSEDAALSSESLLEEFSETGNISKDAIRHAIQSRKLFLCFFGSALKNDGVAEFLESISDLMTEPSYGTDFAARVYKITEDEKGQRLTHMKITGGSLKVRTLLSGNGWEEKASELRIYSGAKYQSVQEVFPGNICAVTGLSKTAAGESLGAATDSLSPLLEPVFTYAVRLTNGQDPHTVLSAFQKLEQEEVQLKTSWNEKSQKIEVRIMGEIQLEILRQLLLSRFGLSVEFEKGSIIYKETVQNPVEGVGHYEPLRHYAEVHILIEPAKRGSGITLRTKCSEDLLDKNWQRLILTHLAEKKHRGVLTGAELTDVRLTLVSGKAHKKHTEGGDFRQATYRAVRQGLMQAENILLEPWYQFQITLPTGASGRAMTDLQQMGAEFSSPEINGEISVISGKAPISKMQDYQAELTAYTHGTGKLQCRFSGYAPCPNQAEIVSAIAYNPESDLENTPDSVFCAHGGGFLVKWDHVKEYMHLPLLETKRPQETPPLKQVRRQIADDAELLRIFERTYGKVKEKKIRPLEAQPTFRAKPIPQGPEYLLIDGYNMIFAWEEFSVLAAESLEDARQWLIERICNYQAMKQNNVILVFDAYRVKGAVREVEKVHGISVVYTKEAETADAYIEKTTKQLAKHYRVRVATSDALEQMIIFGHGARRISAGEFYEEVKQTEQELRQFLKDHNEEYKLNIGEIL